MAERKLVALTFDDGRHLELQTRYWMYWRKNNVVASFFPDWSEHYGADRVSGEACLQYGLYDREPFQDTSIHDRSDQTGDPG